MPAGARAERNDPALRPLTLTMVHAAAQTQKTSDLPGAEFQAFPSLEGSWEFRRFVKTFVLIKFNADSFKNKHALNARTPQTSA